MQTRARWALSLLIAITNVQLAWPALAQTAMLEGGATYRDLNPPSTLDATAVQTGAPQANERPALAPDRVQARPSIRVPIQNAQTVQKPHTVYLKDTRTFWQRHPMVKGAAIGGGVGAGAGALTGLISHQGILRGAVIGAGTGAGVGVIRTSKIMARHPIARDVATGAASGLGIGWAGSRRPGIALAGTGIGAAIGLGTGLFTQLR
jgi:hypothetical protein